MLPKKGGLEVLQTLKSHPELKQIPVVILSNLDSDEDIKQAIFLGAEDYYVKTQHPIAEVVEKVDTILRRPKQAKA
jgi:DNA-binding response OmpR family regulator